MSADREVIAATSPVPAEVPVSTALPIAAAVPVTLPAPGANPHTEDTHALCANCGASVAGHFCSHCGQRVEHAVHSLWHFIAEATEDLTHADSRVWRTIGALLFKPGFLTTEFLAGRRVRYLPPIRLYLVMSVLFFLFLAISPHHTPT